MAALSAMELSPSAARAAIYGWAQAHTESLPSTASEIAAYPESYRTAILRALPQDRRFRVIASGLEDLLAARQDLTAGQRAYLESLRTRLLAALDADASAEAAIEDGLQECAEQRALFPDRELWEQIAEGAVTSYSRPAYRFGSVMAWARETGRSVATAVLASAEASDMCNCNQEGYICDCPAAAECQDNGCQSPEANICMKPGIGCLFPEAAKCDGWCPQ